MMNTVSTAPRMSDTRHVPGIDAYPMPDASLLALNRVGWTVEPARAALLVHDMQNYWISRFVDPALLIANVAALLRAARDTGMPVIFSVARRELRPEDRGLAFDMWGAGIGGGRHDPRDEEIVDPLQPRDSDVIVEKRKISAFFRTDLEADLRDRGIDQLVITGVYAHHGCLLSAADAYMRDIKPFFVIDATADHSEAQHLDTCRLIPSLCGQNVTTATMQEAMGA